MFDNRKLAKLRDRQIEALVGAASGQATFYLVEDFHGFSTMIESHAQAAQQEFGKGSQALLGPVTTLRELCEAIHGSLYQLEDRALRHVGMRGTLGGSPAVGGDISLESVPGRAVLEKQTVHIEDVLQELDRLAPRWTHLQWYIS